MLNSAESGGYLPSPRSITPITSPAASHASYSSSTTSTSRSRLPHPRRNPLRAGSAKEDAARRYVEGRMLGISRRFVKKGTDFELGDGLGVRGYKNFGEVSADLAEVMDVLWLSGTPSLQIPYLLNVALSTQSYLPSFPFAPKSTFTLLRKLDHVLASLVRGVDVESRENLPGFDGERGGMSRTDMVRVKGVVEGTRVVVVEISVRDNDEDGDLETVDEEEQDHDDDSDDDMDGDGYVPDKTAYGDMDGTHKKDDDETMQIDIEKEGENDMDVAKVYELTIMALGQALGAEASFGAASGT